MKLRIIKNRPKFLPGGDIQDTTQQADVQSNPYGSTEDMFKAYLPDTIQIEQEQSDIDNIITPGSFKMPEPSMSTNNVTVDPNTMPKGTVVTVEEEDPNKTKRSQDGNPLDMMTEPYAPDLQGRAEMLGRSLGNIRAGNKNGANIAQAALSGISLAAGLTRNIMGASSAAYAQARDEQAAREKLANDRRNQFIRWEEDGGGVNLGNGERMDTSDMTGEYIYPLPKSMQDSANVEIEKGEYVLTPEDVGPREAKGEKHKDGGTPVELDEAYIVSDHLKINDEFASYLRENYGLTVSPKDTYATVLDRYKKKIGLADKYADQEKAIKRLEKNQSVKDKNTSELNKSVLSKYINDNQSEIDMLEERFRAFADIVYNAQENAKRTAKMDSFYADGGKVSMSSLRKQAKALGISEEDAKNWIYDEYVSRMRKMAIGGPSEEDLERMKKLYGILNKQFGRPLNMSVVDVAGRESILNEDSDVNANQNLQNRGNYGYGRVNQNAITNLLDVNRWASPLNANGDFDTEGFQTGYNKRLNELWALADSGAISNADAAKAFRDQYGFWGQDNGKYDQGNKPAYNSFGVDDKFGQTTATRSYYGLDVLTPEQKRLLNEKGIKNYVDLFGDKAADAQKILGDDYKKFKAIKDSGLAGNLDFVLTSFEERPNTPATGTKPRTISGREFRTARQPITVTPNGITPKEEVVQRKEENVPTGTGANRYATLFPEVFRMVDSGLEFEGLERHQAPRVDPVLQSADQYINELNRATASQLDAVGDVPDSQRSAILANMNAIAGSNIAKYIDYVNLNNARQANEADRFNEITYTQTDDKNIAERQRYEAGLLKAMAIRDENLARYYDSINSEIQNKLNVRNSLNTIASIAPNMRMLPNGSIVYTQGDQPYVLTLGDYSTPYLRKMDEEDKSKAKKGGR